MSDSCAHVRGVAARLTELTEELLDAHCDTLCLAGALSAEPRWEAHLQYLKDLQRVGQRTLAELTEVSLEELLRHEIEPPHQPRLQQRLLARLRLPVGQLRR